MRRPSGRREWGWSLLATYSAILAVILLSPSPDASASAVGATAEVLSTLGVSPGGVAVDTYVEFGLNALMVAPVPVLGWLAVPGMSPSDWIASIFGASMVVEAIQGLLLSGRSAQMADVVANTLGAAFGAAIIVLINHPDVRRVTKWAVFRRFG